MIGEKNSMRQCIKCKCSYTLENFKEKKREQYNKTCINCCTMQKEKIEAEQNIYQRGKSNISERIKGAFLNRYVLDAGATNQKTVSNETLMDNYLKHV